MSEWQTIKMAPRDGTHFLAFWPDADGNESACQIETWCQDEDWWHSAYDEVVHESPYAPTHWMPLPEPPEASK